MIRRGTHGIAGAKENESVGPLRRFASSSDWVRIVEGIDRTVPVVVEPAAVKPLMPNAVRADADILALAEWPAEQLRLVVER